MADVGERRVRFDFEVDFSNGGHLQGQDFRLDIEGEDIDAAVLADYLVRDLRLLMVGAVRILNKQVLRERHKRAARPAGPGPAPALGGARRVLDLSGASDVRLSAPGGAAPDLAAVADLPGIVVRVAGMRGSAVNRAACMAALAETDARGMAVLVHTGWDAARDRSHPFLAADAAALLAASGAALVGIDAPDVDDPAAGARPARAALLGAGVALVEALSGLDRLPLTGFRVHAVPHGARAAGSWVVRAYAVVEGG